MITVGPPDWDAVSRAYDLGKIIDIQPVGRAWSNRVFRVRTDRRTYAVKQLLNPWQDPQWKAWLEEAAGFELQAFEAGIRMPEPILSVAGTIMVDAEQPVRVHGWVAGPICPDGPMAIEDAALLGEQLARTHLLDHRPDRADVFPQPDTASIDGWPDLMERLRRTAPELAELAAQAAPAVREIDRLLSRSVTDFTGQPMSHGDVDQKNVIMGTGGPVLCDWDVAAPWPPRQELARTALSLAGWERPDVARAVINAYRDAGGEDVQVRPEDFGIDLRVGLDWVVMCAERASGLTPADHQRRAEATDAAPGLLAGLNDHVRQVLEIEAWLAS